jgi:hypothetical protein
LLSVEQIHSRVDRLAAKFNERDGRMSAVREVRAGRISGVFPEFFGEQLTQPMVSNFVDVVARDLAEVIAPLPALNCASSTVTNDSARKFAAKRQRVGTHYWLHSRLSLQMFAGADQYLTNGFLPFIVEPDFKAKLPRIRVIDPWGCYPELDPNGRCVAFARKWRTKAMNLATVYPHLANLLMDRDFTGKFKDGELEVIHYVDDDQCVAYVPSRKNLILEQYENVLGECPVEIAVRPSPDGEMRGQFDDILGVQAARAIMMRLAVEGAEKQVQAPLALPDDVTELNIGPDAIIRSATPEKIRRVELGISNATFAESAALADELRHGARYPEQRTGGMDGSIVTGRGVEALLGGFDTQVKTAQTVFANVLQRITRLCFIMDEKLWPNERKTIRGTAEGTPFEITYTPAKDIAGDFTCDVTYGFLAGMDPNRALVFMLQALGAGLVDRGTVQRHMPFEVDVNALQQNIDVERLRDAGMAGVLAYVQAIGPIAQQGGDPAEPLVRLAKIINGRQAGTPLEDLLSKAFLPTEEEQAAAQAAAEQQQSGGVPPGMEASGLLDGVAPGQAGMPPGGRPPLQMLMAALGNNGQPSLRAGVRRAIPTGG